MNYGFVRVATAIPGVKVGDCKYNAPQIESLIIQAEGKGVEIICFPELSITAYSCGDLFSQQLLLDEAEMCLIGILDFTRSLDIISIIGLPISYHGTLLNCAAVIQKGKILGLVPKTYLPNYKEFYEQRWFTSGDVHGDCNVLICGQLVHLSRNIIFNTPSCCFGVEICEDVWAPIPPSSELALKGAEIIFNLSADNEGVGKQDYLKSLLAQQSARCLAGYVFSGAGFGESTQDLVFAGKGFIYENGTLLAESERFSFKEQLIYTEIDVECLRSERLINTTFSASLARIHSKDVQQIDTELFSKKEIELSRVINPSPFVPTGKALEERCEEVFAIQIEGLAKRLVHTQTQTVVIGISGGLDSTLALLVCTKTFDKLGLPRKGIIGITMPGFGTTDRTYHNAISLMESLEITIREISINQACIQHFKDIDFDMSNHNTTYENGQARERTQILMDVANQMNGLVVGTGDLSEQALGWATYNGDHMSMYGVNASIPKTLVRHLVNWVAENIIDEKSQAILLDIVDTPISPELIPADEDGNISQKTEDLVGPYELHDFFLYYVLRFGFRPSKIFYLAGLAFKEKYTDEVIKMWLTTFFRRFFSQQFKRSCLPDGPKVGSCSLSPRGDWRMPSDASATAWIDECNNLME
ncbi:MAG: NAD(+) synthase [Paraprevotella sp.]|nr:NAD(+) synthase [Paraprevotella sp.]